MEASYKLLVRMGWKKFDDFLPLLILNEDRVEKILYVEPSRIKDRVYAFSKEFSVSFLTSFESSHKCVLTFLHS